MVLDMELKPESEAMDPESTVVMANKERVEVNEEQDDSSSAMVVDDICEEQTDGPVQGTGSVDEGFLVLGQQQMGLMTYMEEEDKALSKPDLGLVTNEALTEENGKIIDSEDMAMIVEHQLVAKKESSKRSWFSQGSQCEEEVSPSTGLSTEE